MQYLMQYLMQELVMNDTARTFTDGVGARLNHYASRGAFRAFSETGSSLWRGTWRARWYQDRTIEIVADGRRRSITLKNILPAVERTSVLDRNLRAFVSNQTGNAVPSHRRLGESRDSVRITNRGGDISIALKADEGVDSQTLTDRAISLGQQIYTVFLREGGYDDYLVDAFDVDLDAYL